MCLDLAFDCAAGFSAGFREIVSLLQVEPEFGAVAEEAGETKCRVWRNAAPGVDDVADSRGGHAELYG